MPRIVKRLPALPAERALEVVAGRWKAVLLHRLFAGPQRLNALKRAIPAISQKVLIQQLRAMEEHGLVTRTVFAEVPPRVEYELTDLVETLFVPARAIAEWAVTHHDEIERARAEYDAR